MMMIHSCCIMFSVLAALLVLFIYGDMRLSERQMFEGDHMKVARREEDESGIEQLSLTLSIYCDKFLHHHILR